MVLILTNMNMIRLFLVFILLFGAFWFGISGFRNLTGRQRWHLTKLLGYSIMCAILSTLFLIGIVILF
jgi:hypothetical protein